MASTEHERGLARERSRRWYAAHRNEVMASQRRRRAEHRDKDNAHSRMNHEYERHGLRRGPCEVCGAEKTDGHHDDYSKPLDVRWLCRLHHMEIHHGG